MLRCAVPLPRLRAAAARCMHTCTTPLLFQATRSVFDAGQKAPFEVFEGTRITVTNAFNSNSKEKKFLRAGLQGTVKRVDEDGDVFINFDHMAKAQCVRQRNFGNISFGQWARDSVEAALEGQRVNDAWGRYCRFRTVEGKTMFDTRIAELRYDGQVSHLISYFNKYEPDTDLRTMKLILAHGDFRHRLISDMNFLTSKKRSQSKPGLLNQFWDSLILGKGHKAMYNDGYLDEANQRKLDAIHTLLELPYQQ